MDISDQQKFYIYLKDKNAWCEGDDDFAKILNGLKQADEKDLQIAFVEVKRAFNASTTSLSLSQSI